MGQIAPDLTDVLAQDATVGGEASVPYSGAGTLVPVPGEFVVMWSWSCHAKIRTETEGKERMVV
jgi:hypothetical protein